MKSKWNWAKCTRARWISPILGASALTTPAVVLAHDGHGNTPLHAIMHMLEANGIWIGLMLLAGIGTLAYQALRRSSGKGRVVGKRERHDDPR